MSASIAGEVEDRVRLEHRRSPVRTEGISESQWVLLDCGDVVVYVFAEETRRFYEIERLYRDRPAVDWRTQRAQGTGGSPASVCNCRIVVMRRRSGSTGLLWVYSADAT